MVDADGAAVGAERERLQARHAAFAAGCALAVALWMAAIAAASAPPALLGTWLLAAVLAALVNTSALPALQRLPEYHAGTSACLQQAGAALSGLVAGAAGTLFLADLSWSGRTAMSIAACAGLAGAITEPGRQGQAFRLQLACCAGQFALAWWRLDDSGAGIVAATLTGFALLAAAASSRAERLNRLVLAGSIENRQLARSLAAARDQAIAADRAKSHFIAAASHDLRQPAAALALSANLLRKQIGDPLLAPAMQGLERSVAALNGLLERLLDLSRLDTGQIEPQRRPVAIDALVDDLLKEAAPRALALGLRLRAIRCGGELDCDPVLVTRMLRNLIDNALRHTERGGIAVTARARPGFELVVSDTGCGIAAEHQRLIFEEHYQVGNASRQRGQGLGLGLAIVRRLAALHDVSVSLRSRPGRGSRFTLRFRSAAFRPLASRPDPSGRERPGVLLVEDDELVADAFEQWLKAAGFSVRRAPDAVSASAILQSCGPLTAALSDFRLPGEHDGIWLLEQVRQHHPGAIRILVSGDLDPELPHRASRAGLRLLAKPIDPKTLYDLLARPLG